MDDSEALAVSRGKNQTSCGGFLQHHFCGTNNSVSIKEWDWGEGEVLRVHGVPTQAFLSAFWVADTQKDANSWGYISLVEGEVTEIRKMSSMRT